MKESQTSIFVSKVFKLNRNIICVTNLKIVIKQWLWEKFDEGQNQNVENIYRYI